MTEREHDELINFAADQWALILIDETDKNDHERGECARLHASYGPPKQ
jgi:hypothetical protein